MYLCDRGIYFASFYDFDIGFWNCSDSVDFFAFSILLFMQGFLKFIMRDKNLTNSLLLISTDYRLHTSLYRKRYFYKS